ncbi:MAG: hypothetical protein AAFN66_05380 [Pseudomonadota bacterium]
MGDAIKVVVLWEDSTGRTAPTTHYFENTNSINAVKNAALDIVQKEENLTDAVFAGASMIVPIVPGFFGSLTLKATPNECDVENKARFEFETVQGDTRTIEVPCPRNDIIDDSSNLIDVTTGAAQTYVNDILTNGWFDGATQLNETDKNGFALNRVTGAFQRFRKSRKKRSAIRLQQ